MLYKINQLREQVFHEVFQVYRVFQNYFGEQSVDLQHLPDDDQMAEVLERYHAQMREDGSGYEMNGRQLNYIINNLAATRPFILVYWPRVKVTNENDASIIIQDLYAKIELDSNGNIPTENRGFLLNRATYPMEQWVSNYMHSHISSIPKGDLTEFQHPCLGSGPIIKTINNLKADLSEGFDDIRWMLFCEELSRYVTVESLEGIPYKRLEEVCMSGKLTGYGQFNNNILHNTFELRAFINVFNKSILQDFIQYYLKHGHLALNYQNGTFVIGLSYFDYIIDISNAFIDYFNSHFTDWTTAEVCFRRNILYKAVTVGGKFYEATDSVTLPDVSMYVGKKVCNFKGHEVRLSITDDSDYNPQETTVLNHCIAMFILNNIIKVVNYHYKNEYNRKQGDNSPDSTTPAATTHQTVYYL